MTQQRRGSNGKEACHSAALQAPSPGVGLPRTPLGGLLSVERSLPTLRLRNWSGDGRQAFGNSMHCRRKWKPSSALVVSPCVPPRKPFSQAPAQWGAERISARAGHVHRNMSWDAKHAHGDNIPGLVLWRTSMCVYRSYHMYSLRTGMEHTKVTEAAQLVAEHPYLQGHIHGGWKQYRYGDPPPLFWTWDQLVPTPRHVPRILLWEAGDC